MDRMTSFNGGAVTMVYDGDGNRVAKTAGGVTTEYLIDDSNPTGLPQVAEEVVGGAVARRYVYGTNRISQTQAGTTSLYDYDAHDDVRALMSATPLAAGGYPTPTDTYDYDAFGNIVGSTGTTPNVYRYQGEALDAETGLYYLRARYYDPVAGRFLSVDPMTDQGEHPYTYVGADPGNGHDPTGKANAIEYALVLAYFTPALFHVPLIPDRISRMGGIMFSNGTGGSVQDATVRQCKASPPRPAGAGQARRDGRRLAAPRVLPTNGGSLCV
jgi:RHS repeat-associated protein